MNWTIIADKLTLNGEQLDLNTYLIRIQTMTKDEIISTILTNPEVLNIGSIVWAFRLRYREVSND